MVVVVSTLPGPLAEIAAQVEEAASAEELQPGERVLKLRLLRDQLITLTGDVSSRIDALEQVREADYSQSLLDELYARGVAGVREKLVREGLVTAQDADGVVVITPPEFDLLHEEGRLDEAVSQIVEALRDRVVWENVPFSPLRLRRAAAPVVVGD